MGGMDVRAPPGELIRRALSNGRRRLTEPEAKSLLGSVGIAVPEASVAASEAEAVERAGRIGFPVMVKVVSPTITHKTEVGGVVGPVNSVEELTTAYRTVLARVARNRPDADIDGILVEAFRPAGLECIASLRMDEAYGPVVMFGLGGVLVEILDEVRFRLAPLRDADIQSLITEGTVGRCLRGIRGRPPADCEALGRTLQALASLATLEGVGDHLQEIEVNPLSVGASGTIALDALVTLKPRGG